MATVQERNGSYRVLFVYGGRRETFTLGVVSKAVAEAKAVTVDELLNHLKRGRLTVPAGVPITEFMKADGKVVAAEEPPAPPPERVTLAQLRDRYVTAHRQALEGNTLGLIETHFRHLVATFGERFAVGGLTLDDLQAHAERRAVVKSRRGTPVSAITIKKEFVTLRAAWNWATHHALVAGAFPPVKHVKLGKVDEKPPFQTRKEIERQLAGGGKTDAEAVALWESLYLTPPELAELLAHVRAQKNAVPWIFPMVATAAHTGARRSELLRVEVGDLNLAGDELTVRERKRTRGVRTTRRVSLSPFLAGVLAEWVKLRPPGKYLFAQAGVLARSKKRSKGTGYVWGEKRPTTGAGRKAAVKRREVIPDAAPVTEDEASDHFRRALAGSTWEVVRGWHVLRHSFISACANKGVDQRIIDGWTGHSTEEQRKRYRHLYPSTQQAAMASVFG